MANDTLRTSPDHENEGWPPGVPYIIGNEGCERFSFYGMKAILFVHLTSLYVAANEVVKVAEDKATGDVHTFIAGVYAFPMIGAIIADRLLGKYRTIFWLSIVYCAGHAVLSMADTTMVGMFIGLALIAVGSGGIKPCVSANVGDQFGKKNWFRVRTVFQYFYFIINFGSAFATLIIPWTRDRYGASIAFAIPGILMGIATLVFWMGRKKFVNVPPKPGGKLGLYDAVASFFLFMTVGQLFFTASMPWYVNVPVGVVSLTIGLFIFSLRQKIKPDDGFLAISFFSLGKLIRGDRDKEEASDDKASDDEKSALSKHWLWGPAVRHFGLETAEGPVAVVRIITVFFLVSVFWALFDQHSSSWIRQAKMMDRHVDLPIFGQIELLPSQLPALNPFMVMALIPIMNGVYKLVERFGIKATPLRRMSVGMLCTSFSFVVVALIQGQIDSTNAAIKWVEPLATTGQIVQAQGGVSVLWQIVPYLIITTSEVMVSITGLEFAYTQAPNRMKSTIMGFWLLTVALGNVLVAVISHIPEVTLQSFFWLFAGLMAGAGFLFSVRAYFYKVRDFTQE